MKRSSGKKKTGKNPCPSLDETSVVSSTEMTGIAPAGIPEQPGSDGMNELWDTATRMVGAHADRLPKTTKK